MRTAMLVSVLLVSAGCGEPDPLSANIDVDVRVGDVSAACGERFAVGVSDTEVELADARFFLSRLQARSAAGDWVDLSLTESDWQHDGIVLIDVEDGTGACADSGTSQTNDTIQATLPDDTYEALRFDVGIPFESNHLDSATAPSPLNAVGMFWAWQGGYKFVRTDIVVPGDTPSRWNVHIGSTQCESAAPTVAPVEPCGRPNRATVTLEGTDPTAEGATLSVDLGALFASSEVTVNTEDTPPGCMSSPAEGADCDPVYAALGLDFETGSCVDDCAGQAVFE